MTWDKFKDFVESKGVTGDMEIEFIDIDFFDGHREPIVVIHGDEFSIE